MDFKISVGCHEGITHQKERQTFCEDVVSSYQDSEITIIAVADGCSNSSHAREAATMNVNTVIELFKEEEAWEWSKEELRDELTKRIWGKFKKTGRKGADMLATLTAIVIRNDGNYMGVSVGDGFIVGINDNFEPTILRYPYNRSGEPSKTIFTINTEDCKREMVVTFNTLEKGISCQSGGKLRGFIIGTDGAGDLLIEWPKIGGKLMEELAMRTVAGESGCSQNLARVITESGYSKDDVSICCLMVNDNDLVEKASRLLQNAVSAPPAPEPQEEPADSIEEDAIPEEETEEDIPEFEPEPQPEETIQESPVSMPSFQGVPKYYYPVLYTLVSGGKTGNELEEEGVCLAGKSLEMLLPLIAQGIVCYENGLFRLNQ